MNNIIKKRLNANFKRSMHYLTLVFNDFFILALIFLFGALMFWYAQNIKKWPHNLWFYKPLIALIWTVVLGIGNFATLFKRADEQFLFNEDDQLKEYFKPLYRHSLILPVILIVLVSGLLFPFATLRAGVSVLALILIAIGLVFAKDVQFHLVARSFYFNNKEYYNYWMFLLVNYIFILLSIQLNYLSWLYLAVTLIVWEILPHLEQGKAFNWYKAIDYEERRQDLVNSFYSMFTDVPEKKIKIRRRKYFDFFITKKNQTPNTFLYQRVLLRDPEYSNLLLRMMIFSVLLSWALQDYIWAGAIGALIIFLTLYQLIPLGIVYEHNVMYHVQPIPMAKRGQALARVLQKGMLIEWIVISAGMIVFSPQKILAIGMSIGLLIFTFALLYGYLPLRIEKLFKKVRY